MHASLDLYKVGPYATKDGDCPFHCLEGVSSPETVQLMEYEPVRPIWIPYPCKVQKSRKCPDVFMVDGDYVIAFPAALTDDLSRQFPRQFEWLPLDVTAEAVGEFGLPEETAFAKEINSLSLHAMHCTRPVHLAEQAQAAEFEPSGKKKRDVSVFLHVETYAFLEQEIAGLDVFFLRQDLALLCTKRFQDAIRARKLSGLCFDPVRAIIV